MAEAKVTPEAPEKVQDKAADEKAPEKATAISETSKTVQAKRSASDALKASDIETLEKEAAAKQATEALARAESEENLNWGQIAKEPPVEVKQTAVEVKGGAVEATVIVAAFSVIDEDGIHNSFVKGDRIKISQKAYDRGVKLGALKQ
jgi:Flp pilus assembly secretin CpaC